MRMKTKISVSLIALSLVAVPVPLALAQQDSPEEDASFLENLIQNALGGEGRTVRVVGLSGVLSSEATIERIEISDDDGTWLQVRDVSLDWRRLALLRGRLEVDALTVGVVDVARKPLPAPGEAPKLAADPEAEPEPFSLPDLPVSVNVAQLSIGAIRLGEPVLGQAVELSLSGQAQLAGGEGNANLSLVRIDGKEAGYRLAAGYTNDTGVVLVDLDVSEEPGGLITTLAGIPDSPSLSLTLKGEDPISDFTADLALRTSDVDRLSGTISLRDLPGTDTPEREITADVAGDVADLFLPDYRDFFGRRIELALRARQGEAIGLDIEDLALTTRGLQLTGTADLSPAYMPQTLDLEAHLGTDLGLPVVLPLPGTPMLVHDADLSIIYDEAAGDTFAVTLDGDGFMRADGLMVDSVSFATEGQLTKDAPTDITAALAQITGTLTGFASTDPALWDAAGDAIALSGKVDWQKGGALTVTGFNVASQDLSRPETGDIAVTGDATVTGLETQAIALTTQIDAQLGDLDRLSAISGQNLGGAIDAKVAANYDTVSGGFDVELDGFSTDLLIGDAGADALMSGRVELGIAAARTADGISLDRLELDGGRVDLTGSGGIDPQGWPRAITLAGRVGAPDGPPVVIPAPGPRTTLQSAQINLTYDPETGDEFQLDLTADDFQREGEVAMDQAKVLAIGELSRTEATVEGVTARITAALTGLSATDPDLSDVIAPGLAFDTDIAWIAEEKSLTVDGLDLNSGDVSVAADVAISDLLTPEMVLDADFNAQTGPLARFAALAGLDLAGSANARGTAKFATETGFFDVDLRAEGTDVATGITEADQAIGGDSTLVVQATRNEDGLDIQQAELQTREISVTATGGIAGDVTTVSVAAGLRDVGLFAPGFNGPLEIDATAKNQNDIWSIDGDLTGPGGSEARYSGDVLRPDGTMALDLSGALPLGLVNRFLLPRNIDGTARFDLAVNGPPGLESLSGTVSTQGARVADPTLRLALEDIGLNVQLSDANAQLDMNANLSSGGQIIVSGPVGLTGTIPADITARLQNLTLVDPTLYEIALDGEIGVNGPLTGGANIAGQINIGRSEIKIPNTFGGGGAVPDIVHVNESRASYATRRRAGLIKDPEAESGGGSGPVFGLDIVISAPQAIFVRGRGLDVELGGRIDIGGTTASPNPQGGLQLIRGRLDLLSQRLNFDTAEISLQGDLDPDISMVASSDNGDVISKIIIEGPVSEPEFRFESEPELPDDEVLAQLFFGKPVADLTPIELAQLASAINRLQGGGGGVFGFAREALGVDDLSVATDEDGNTAVTAGRYLSEKVYTDVTVGSDGTSEVELNYEIRKDFSARGRFDNEGETGIGLVFERDY
ncbi:hypothetical protein G5B39_11955 [Rhodobacteraceae bacterium SC52]|nr:hypothetical protein G5B39_11955 [Rhodobacteraceae bacterium SC52]